MSKPRPVIFDLFGTLLNIDSLRADLVAVVTDSRSFEQTWRDKLLGYMLATAIMRRYESFDQLASEALAYAASMHSVKLSVSYRHALVDGWRFLHPYSDALLALRRLRDAGYSIGVLTNATPGTGRAALENAGLSDLVDCFMSVDALRTYKPDRRAYELVTSHYEVPADDIVFVTAEGWDATGAAEFGMRVIWCNRTGHPPETLGARPALTIAGLTELPALLTDHRAIAV
jgi:2-haloacid dehalogenase